MSRYQTLMTEILDSIFEGYSIDTKGKLKVVNESAAKKASEKLHTLVLEKSRDLWDQLEAAEDSLSGVAEEISFEELNADPASMSNTISHTPKDKSASEDNGAAAPMESAKNISDLLGTDDFDLSSVFENMDHLDNVHNQRGDSRLPFDEMGGERFEDDGEDVEDGDEEYDDLMIGMDDGGLGSDDVSDGMDDVDYEGGEVGDDLEGDMDMAGGMDDELAGDDMGFDFELDLEGGDDDVEGALSGDDLEGDLNGGDDLDGDLEGGEFGDEDDLEEPELEGMGHGDKSYRMESEGDDDDDSKDDDDDDSKDDDDDDKPAFLKNKDKKDKKDD